MMTEAASPTGDCKDEEVEAGHVGREDSEDAGSDTGEPCFWCGGGIMLHKFTRKSDQLCDVCDKVNLYQIYYHGRESYNPEEANHAELGWLDEHAGNTECPLCRLVVHCLRETYGHGLPETIWQDGQFRGTRVRCYVEGVLPIEDGHDWKKNAHAYGRLYFKTTPSFEGVVKAAVNIPNVSRLKTSTATPLSEGCMESRHMYMGIKRRRLRQDIDPELAKLWLELCEVSHQFQTSHLDLPAQLRVIDLDVGCLASLPTGARYVTLSYVWGGPQEHALRQSNRTNFYQPGYISTKDESLPLTIRDFLTFTLAIGERYAWVDSLCIIQDDTADANSFIGVMDTIYENAIVTVVAASGANASHGLPGLRKGARRMLQGREIIHHTSFGAPLPPLDEVITNSTWDERVWTYQEGILSRRMIVFTDCQMHFKCNQGCTACEETWEDGFNDIKKLLTAKGMHAYEPKMLTRQAASDLYHGSLDNLGWWYEHVRRLSWRSTTEPKDRIHALNGILHHLESMFDDHKFVWGHPSSALDVSLLWRPGEMNNHSMVRNEAIDNTGVTIPSWSWAGWTGPIKYRSWNLCETAHSLVNWIDMNQSGPLEDRRFQVKTCGGPSKEWLTANRWERFNNEKNLGSFYLRNGSENIRYAHPVAFSPDEGPARAVDMTTGELNFFTETAKFQIPPEHLDERALAATELEAYGNFKHICLFDSDGHVAGVVLAEPAALRQLNQTTFECISITNTTLSRVEWDQCYVEDEQRFMHLTDCPIIKSDPERPIVEDNPQSQVVEESSGSPVVEASAEVSSVTDWYDVKFPLFDQNEEWDFYESCWHPKDTITCPYYDLKPLNDRFCVSPFRSIHPTAGPFPFDPRKYSTQRPWPLNEVLIVERSGDIVRRLGVGYVHVDAWHKVREEKHIRLR